MDKNKIKVLYVITKSNWGGAQRYVYDLATRLSKDDFEVAVLCGGEGELVKRLRNANIRVIPLPALTNKIDIWAFPELIRIIRRESPDILHLNSSKIGILGSIAGRIIQVPRIIFTAHGWAFNENRGAFGCFIIKMIHYTTIVLSHTTIVVSQSMHTQIKPLFLKNKITLIYNGLSPISFLTRQEARRALLKSIGVNVLERSFWVGTIAELHPNKGLSYAIQALRTTPDAIYIIIGDGKERDSLRHLAQTEGLAERVFFAGHMNNAAEYLLAFDAFLFPSVTEALGYALLEAGFAGLPSVATSVGGIPEIIKNGETGILVPPKNPKTIAGALSILMQDKKRAGEYGALFATDIKKRFSIDNMMKKTIELYYTEK